MARVFLTAINLSKNELQNAQVQNLTTAPSSPVKGQLYYNNTGGDDTLYWWNGTGWIAAKGGAGAVPATTVTASAVGDASVVGVATTYAREDHKHSREAFGAITAETAFGGASSNGAATTLARSDHTHGNPVHDAAAHSAIPISALAVPTVDVAWNGKKITGLADPTNAQDAATKNYVDNLVAGLNWKDSVRIASTTNLAAISGLAAMDGVTPVGGDRILLKDQTTTNQNGIYIAAAGAWTRATDADASAELVDSAVFVEEGTVNADTAWVMTTNAPITVGTTGMTYVQFAGGGTVTAGAGMTQSGNTLNVIALDASLVVAADSITRGALTGDVTAPQGSNATTIPANTVDNTRAADMVQATIKGRAAAAGTGDPTDLSAAQVKTILGIVSTDLSDFVEGAQDATGAMVDASLVYVDATPLLTRAALTGDVTAPQGSNATTIANDAVTNAKLANMSANSIKGNNTGAGADPIDLSGTQVTAMLDNFTSALKGLVPLSGGGTANFLRADGSWQPPPLDTTAGDTRYGRKYTLATIGGAVTHNLPHNLNTRNVIVNVFRTLTPFDTVECDVERTDANNVLLRFTVAPATNEYTAVVMG